MAGFWLANVLPTTLPGWTFNDVNVGEPILDSEVPDADGNNGEVPIIVEVIVMQSPLELVVTVVSQVWIAIDWPELMVLRVVVDVVTKILLVAEAVSEGGLDNWDVGMDEAVELDEVRTELDGIIGEPTEADNIVEHEEVTTEIGETTELDKATEVDGVVEHNEVVSELDEATELDEVVEHDDT